MFEYTCTTISPVFHYTCLPSLFDRHTFLLQSNTTLTTPPLSLLSRIVERDSLTCSTRETGLDNLANRANRHQMEKKKKRNTYLEQKEKKKRSVKAGSNRKGNENSSLRKQWEQNRGRGPKEGTHGPLPLSLLQGAPGVR